jgi:hypothetical protein
MTINTEENKLNNKTQNKKKFLVEEKLKIQKKKMKKKKLKKKIKYNLLPQNLKKK